MSSLILRRLFYTRCLSIARRSIATTSPVAPSVLGRENADNPPSRLRANRNERRDFISAATRAAQKAEPLSRRSTYISAPFSKSKNRAPVFALGEGTVRDGYGMCIGAHQSSPGLKSGNRIAAELSLSRASRYEQFGVNMRVRLVWWLGFVAIIDMLALQK